MQFFTLKFLLMAEIVHQKIGGPDAWTSLAPVVPQKGGAPLLHIALESMETMRKAWGKDAKKHRKTKHHEMNHPKTWKALKNHLLFGFVLSICQPLPTSKQLLFLQGSVGLSQGATLQGPEIRCQQHPKPPVALHWLRWGNCHDLELQYLHPGYNDK